MSEIAYYEVWQDEALVYESRGVKFRKGKAVKITKQSDIEAFRTDGLLQIREIPVTRIKAAPKSVEKSAKEKSTKAASAPKAGKRKKG